MYKSNVPKLKFEEYIVNEMAVYVVSPFLLDACYDGELSWTSASPGKEVWKQGFGDYMVLMV